MLGWGARLFVRVGGAALFVALILGVGATPALATITVTDAAFGNVRVGLQSTLTVTVTSDVAHFQVTDISISGTGADSFAIGPNGCTPNSSTSCTFDVVFTPTARGSRTAIATVTSDAGPGDNTSSLSGTGVAPVVQVPPSLTFGDEQVGTTSATKKLVVSNATSDAGQNLAISGLSVAGSNAADFAISNDTCTGASIPPSGSCSVDVSFAPSATGARSAAVTVTSDAPPDGLDEVPLSGTGTAPGFSLTPAAVAFPDQEVGTNSASQALTITSTGTAALVIDALSVTGDDYSAVSNTCSPFPASLQPGESCTVELRFNPSTVGPRTGSVHVSTNAGTQDAALTANGTAPTPPTTTSDGGAAITPTPSGDTPPGTAPQTSTTPSAARCVVPTLKGKTLEAARRALRHAHCALGKVTRVRVRRGRGRVMRQGKRAGKHLPAGTRVAVAVGRR